MKERGNGPTIRGNGPGARYSSKIAGEWPRGPIKKQVMEYDSSSIKWRGNGPTIRRNGPGAQYSSKVEGERPQVPIYIGRSKTNSIIAVI